MMKNRRILSHMNRNNKVTRQLIRLIWIKI